MAAERWSGIFGPIPWLASTYLEYFWPIRSPLDHVLTKPRVSLVREDMEDDSQTFFYGSWICPRTGSQSWTIHNPRKNAYTLRLLPIQLHVRDSCVGFNRHVTKQRSDWPELFGMARTKESAQRYQTGGVGQGHVCSQNGRRCCSLLCILPILAKSRHISRNTSHRLFLCF